MALPWRENLDISVCFQEPSNFYLLRLNNKRREKRPWLSVPWRKKWSFHLLPPAYPMSRFSAWKIGLFFRYILSIGMNKKPQNTKHPPQRTTGISKNSWYHDINTLAVLCLSVGSVDKVCSQLLVFLVIFFLYQYYDNLFKQLILSDLIFKLLSIYCSYWRKSDWEKNVCSATVGWGCLCMCVCLL